jgi:hypothetical protein
LFLIISGEFAIIETVPSRSFIEAIFSVIFLFVTIWGIKLFLTE